MFFLKCTNSLFVILMGEKVLIPGDYVGPGEVYEQGATTHLEGDDIYSSSVGLPDESSRSLKTRVSRPELKEGDIVYGSVLMIMESFAILTIFPEAKEGSVPASLVEGKIPVRAMSTGFTPSVRDALRIGDIVRAKVVKVEGEKAELTMVAPELGVIKAFCAICREPLEQKKGGLECANGHKDRRKTANDYRSYGKIMF